MESLRRSDPPGSEIKVELIDDLEAHLAGGAGDDARSGFVVARVQILFRLHDAQDV